MKQSLAALETLGVSWYTPDWRSTGRRLRRKLFPALFWLLLPVSPAVFLQGAFAQSTVSCPAPEGGFSEEVTNPQVTAQAVERDRSLLRKFLLDYVRLITETDADTWHTACIGRTENGPYYSGSTYLITLTLDGRLYVHAKDQSLSGRQLNPQVYAAILSGLGVSASDVASLGSSDPAVAGRAFSRIAARLSAEKPDGAFSFNGQPGLPAASGHAAAYYSTGAEAQIILISGFNLTEAHLIDLSAENIDYGNPSIEAKDVVDRETLKEFVTEAADYMGELLESGGLTAQSKARLALRDPNGPWRRDSIYLYVYDTSSEQTLFNGAFPNRFEFLNAGITEDVVTGELVWTLVEEAARRSPGGGFLSYHFDNPSDDSDEAVPKTGYALEIDVPVPRNDGTTDQVSLIVGSGFYPERVDTLEAVTNEDFTCSIPNGLTSDNVAALRNPPITAQEATDPQRLKEFITYYRDEAKNLENTRVERRDSVYTACIAREKEGPYYSDSIYTVSMTLDGRLLIHAKDMSLSARQLKPQAYAAILSGLGISADHLAGLGSSDPAVAGQAIGAIFAQLSAEEPDGAFSFGGGQSGIPAASGHAAAYYATEGGSPIILLTGFDLTEVYLFDFDEENLDYGSPSIQAKDVVNRETLKAFVMEAAGYMRQALETGDPAAQSRSRLALRNPNGPWKHGSVYLYIYDSVTEQTVFHGAFPDRFEFLNAGISRDAATGELVWDLVQEAAARRRKPEGGSEGGFLLYHFDNPNDDSDEVVPKVGYALELFVPVTLRDGTSVTYEFIVGSGYYPDELAADRQRKSTSLKAWHLRFGRTVSQQVVDALQDRFAASPQAGLALTVAGERLNGTTPLEENQEVLSKLLGFETVTSRQLVQGSSFSFTAPGDGAPARLSFWGQGAFSSFSGSEDEISLDGDVTTAMVGADWSGAQWRAGAALTQSWGSGSYDADRDDDGDITTTLTGVFPYGHYALSPRLGFWATAGYGWGELSLELDNDTEYNPDTTMAMAAAGINGVLLDRGSEGISVSTVADVLTLKTTSEEVDDLESSEGSLSRLRLGLEATRPFLLANDASLLFSLEMGVRQDSGDAETGFGMDLGAGIAWKDPERGISGELRGRTLLAHADEDFQDQGLALSFSWDPSPSNLGPSLSMQHSMGTTATGGTDALLNPVTMEFPDAGSSGGQQFETQLAYGLAIFDDRLTLSPALGLTLSPDSRRYSLLWALQPYSEQGLADAWQLSLDVHRREKSSATSPVDHSLKLGFSLSL